MELQSGIVILKESYHTMSAGEQNIAKYILESPEKVMQLNISDLAAECGGSPAGIVRLCKRLNMKGYNELKLRIAMDISREQDTHNSGTISHNLPPEKLRSAIIGNHIDSLRSIESVLDTGELQKAADIVLDSRRIDIYGLGASGIVAQDMYQKLCRIGLNASHVPDSHMQITSACSLGQGDTFIAVSYSGETREMVKAARIASENGARGISLTRYGANSLEEICDTNLFTPMTESLLREAAMTSRIAQLTVIDILFSLIISGSNESFKEILDRTKHAIRDEGGSSF